LAARCQARRSAGGAEGWKKDSDRAAIVTHFSPGWWEKGNGDLMDSPFSLLRSKDVEECDA